MYFKLSPDSLWPHGHHPFGLDAQRLVSWIVGVTPIVVILAVLALLTWLACNVPNQVDYPPIWF